MQPNYVTMTRDELMWLVRLSRSIFEKSTTVNGKSNEVNETPQKTTQKSSQKVIELISVDDKITTQEMADKLEISRRAVAKTIAKLQSAGILRRVGPDKGGHREIITTDREAK